MVSGANTGNNVTTGMPSVKDYKRLTLEQQIKMKCDMYMGSADKTPRDEWLLDMDTMRINRYNIDLPYAVSHLFCEIMSNAGDNVERSRLANFPIGRIDVDMDYHTVSVTNGGLPIPIEIVEEEGVYLPEMLFGMLLTSSNYDEIEDIGKNKGKGEEKERTVVGTNGYGSKLTNLFSKQFAVIICNGIQGLRYEQVWNDGMTIRGDPVITKYEGASSVQIIFVLDLERFGYEEYPSDAFALFSRIALDTSFANKVPVSFCGREFYYPNISDYAQLYFNSNDPTSTITDASTDPINTTSPVTTTSPTTNLGNHLIHLQWKEGETNTSGLGAMIELFVLDTPDEGAVVSLVNGQMTKDGGVHVDAVMNAIGAFVVDLMERKSVSTSGKEEPTPKGKGKKSATGTKPKGTVKIQPKLNINDIRPHLTIVLNTRLNRPKFNSQNKTCLVAPTPHVLIPPKTLATMGRWTLIDRLEDLMKTKQKLCLSKMDGKKRIHITLNRAIDCNWAGGVRSGECICFALEGKSAMGYGEYIKENAKNGSNTVGIFPFKGKPINVMEATGEDIFANDEIKELIRMLGLQMNVDYRIEANYRTLRYGYFIILADADEDGKHIMGLILLIFYILYPTLLARQYVWYMQTPIVRLYKGNQTIKFYTQNGFDEWKKTLPENELKKWQVKYYKGLGTSSEADVADDYKSIRIVQCGYDEHAPSAFNIAFNKKLVKEKKNWMMNWNPCYKVEDLSIKPISSFINHELIQFALSSMRRAIPHYMDGLKLTQRKIIWSSLMEWSSGNNPAKGLKKKLNEIKLVQLVGLIMKSMCYHHGDKAMSDTIVSMAHDFVGHNNLPYFTKDGQLGTRPFGGKNTSASRYPNTRLQWWIPYIFRKEDVPLLNILNEDGMKVEPEYLLPILPMHLINGAHGIGSGFSTFIPNHDPLAICKWIRQKLGNQPTDTLIPWYRGFQGNITIVPRKTVIDKKEIETLPQLARQKVTRNPDETGEDNPIDIGEMDPDEEEVEHDEASIAPTAMSMRTEGVFTQKGMITHITELPIGLWTNDYDKWLRKLIEGKHVKNVEFHSNTKIIDIKVIGFKNPSIGRLKLSRSYGLTNMTLLDDNRNPVKYKGTQEVMEAFFNNRFPFYKKRHESMLTRIKEVIDKSVQKKKLIQEYLAGNLKIANREEDEVQKDLERLGISFDVYKHAGFRGLTKTQMVLLDKQIDKLTQQYNEISKILPANLWLDDLDEFETAYCKNYKLPLPDYLKQARPKANVQLFEEEDEE